VEITRRGFLGLFAQVSGITVAAIIGLPLVSGYEKMEDDPGCPHPENMYGGVCHTAGPGYCDWRCMGEPKKGEWWNQHFRHTQ